MRAFAEKSVEQARQAFDGFISAAHHAVNTFEGQAETARQGAKDVTEKAMTFAEQNVASSFEFAQQLVRAKDVQDVHEAAGRLHQTADAGACSEQAKELGESTTKAAKEAATPKRLKIRAPASPKKSVTTLDCASQYFYCVAPRAALYSLCIKTAVALPVRMTATGPFVIKHGSAVGADPCDAGSSPQRTNSMTEAIESKSKSKAAPTAFEMPKFELPNFEIPKMEIPAAFRELGGEERLAGEGDLREDEVRRRGGDRRARGHLRDRDQGRLRLRPQGDRGGAREHQRRVRLRHPDR